MAQSNPGRAIAQVEMTTKIHGGDSPEDREEPRMVSTMTFGLKTLNLRQVYFDMMRDQLNDQFLREFAKWTEPVVRRSIIPQVRFNNVIQFRHDH